MSQFRRRITWILVAGLAVALLACVPATASAAYVPPVLKVAVVRSQVSQDWGDYYGDGTTMLQRQDAVYDYLLGRGWDVERIVDADLTNLAKLRTYDVVVLQSVFCMTPEASQTMVRYVAGGGGIVNTFASPRVAPWYSSSRSGDSWLTILGHGGWEWGPLSEAYQMLFVDDFGPIKFHATPVAGHPIISTTQAILQARGYASSDVNIWRDQSSLAWVELSRQLSGNPNTARFLNMIPDQQPSQSSASYKSADYVGTHDGAVAATYLDGRAVYFGFGLAEMLPTMDWWGSASQLTKTTGVPQGEVVGAYLESAIVWASGDSARPGVVVRDGRTYANVDVYVGGIYASQYTLNRGNVTVTGTLYFRVYDPWGRKVAEDVRYKIGVEPGKVNRYSQRYITSRLADGLYRVEVEYRTTYPTYERRYIESVYVRRSQGTAIQTRVDSARTVGQVVYDPRIVRIAGPDRYATALAIADAAGDYPRPEGWVVIASGEAGADALVASAVAAAYDAPVILTQRTAFPATVDTWLQSAAKGFQRAMIVGGEGVVSPDVEERLEEIFGEGEVVRLAGNDRYGTAAEVARAVRERLGVAYDGSMIVANGNALADAAGASAVAAGLGRPLVFVRRDEVPTATIEVISELTSDQPSPDVWIVGGSGVVSDEVEGVVEDLLGGDVPRAAGADRYATAAALAELATATGCTWSEVGVASGVKLADALCLGPLVARDSGVMVLAPGPSLSSATRSQIVSRKYAIGRIVVGGGTAVVSHAACAEASSLLP